MVKGCQRNIVYLKNTGSPYFEEAYFIIDDKYVNERLNERDLVKEANKVIEDNLCREALKFEKLGRGVRKTLLGIFLRSVLPFIVGALLGAVCISVLF